jgi:type II secretory pathway component PulF
MSTYRYIARKDGQRIRGELEATGKQHAIDTLLARRVSPIEVERAEAEKLPVLKYKDASRLCSEIARMTSAGVPLEAGVALAAEAQESKAARQVLERASTRLTNGDGPAKAFDGLQGAPGRALSAVVAAGERSGRLADALKSAAPLFSSTAKFREKIVSLLLYPAAVSVTAVAVIVVFMLVVIPALRPLLEDLGDELPTSAAIMLAMSDGAPGFFIAILASIMIAIFLGQIPSIRQAMARVRDQIALSPVGLGLAQAVDMALFSSLFAALLKAGTPAGDAISKASGAISNTILKSRLNIAAGAVREGTALDVALAEALGERHIIVQASRLGAKGGSYAELVSEAGMTLSERAEVRLERLAAMASPLITIVLGFMIGMMVLALFSSLTALTDAATL